MTPERWSTLCQSLDALSGPELEQAIAAQRAEVLKWPSDVRSIGADSPWLKGVFEGLFDPRLELVGRATIAQRLEGRGVNGGMLFELIKVLGAHLDRWFDPPDVVLEEEDNIRSAYGCGGGSAWWTRGTAARSIQFHSTASESPSMGMRSHDQWKAVGLASDASLVIKMDDFVDGLEFEASGPCPRVLELGPAWAAVVRGADLVEVRRVLASKHVPWRLSGFPQALMGALFVAEDGKLSCRVERGEGKEGADWPLVTTVFSRADGPQLLSRAATKWHPVEKPASEVASERLGHLDVELGVVGAGNLYTLYVVRRNPDQAKYGPKDWIAALPDTPLSELRLFPEYGQSPYTPDDWDWQEGWWYPYSTFRAC